jgi:hypothetical protein
MDIRRCVQDGFLRASHLNKKPTQKPFLLSCLDVLKLTDRPSYPRLLHQMKPWSIIVNQRQGSPWNGTILNLPGTKNSESPCQKARSWSQSYGTAKEWDSCGCDASRGDSQLWCLHQNAERTQEAFQTSVALICLTDLQLGSGPYRPDAPRPSLKGPLCPVSIHGSPVKVSWLGHTEAIMLPRGNTDGLRWDLGYSPGVVDANV